MLELERQINANKAMAKGMFNELVRCKSGLERSIIERQRAKLLKEARRAERWLKICGTT